MIVGLDNLDTVFAQFAPPVTVTITPLVKNIHTTGALTIGGAGADIQGRVLAPLTLSQTQMVPTTGHGHQDATRATGSLAYFNGSFAPRTIPAGTLYTGTDGVQVATNETATIPAANPPYVGQTSVPAHAIFAGSGGNIQAGDIAITTTTLQVRNGQFQHGQDARDFPFVQSSDIQGVVSTLTPRLLQSEQAALAAQVSNSESFIPPLCTQQVNTNHNAGEEALSVTVTVSETCSAVVYNTTQLQTTAAKILTTHAATQIGRGYTLYGQVQVRITKTTPNNKNVVVTLSASGTWIYQLNEPQVKNLIVDKPRLNALRILSQVPGVQTVNIVGVSDNELLPIDPAHIQVHILYFVP